MFFQFMITSQIIYDWFLEKSSFPIPAIIALQFYLLLSIDIVVQAGSPMTQIISLKNVKLGCEAHNCEEVSLIFKFFRFESDASLREKFIFQRCTLVFH